MGQTPWLAVARRPHLWGEAARAAWGHRRAGWWRRFPFLPLPARHYLAWRRVTVYGDRRRIEASDLVGYLAWRRHLREVKP